MVGETPNLAALQELGQHCADRRHGASLGSFLNIAISAVPLKGLGTLPANDHQAFCRIEHLPPAAVEAVACKHFLRRLRGHLRKN